MADDAESTQQPDQEYDDPIGIDAYEDEDLDRGGDEGIEEPGGELVGRQSAEPDVLLDVPQLKVDEIALDVEDLRARVSLQAEVLDLLKLNVGADVALGRVHLDIKGVEARALLKVRLDQVAAIVGRVLTTIDRNPQILEQITSGIAPVAEELGKGVGRSVGELGRGAGEAVGEVGRGAGEAVGEVGRGAGRAVEDVGEHAGEAVEDVGGQVGETVGAIGETAEEATGEATEGAEEGIEEIGESAARDRRPRGASGHRTARAVQDESGTARRSREPGESGGRGVRGGGATSRRLPHRREREAEEGESGGRPP